MGVRIYKHGVVVRFITTRPGGLWSWKCQCGKSDQGFDTQAAAQRAGADHVKGATGR